MGKKQDEKMTNPRMLMDQFGDWYLGCPKCRSRIYFGAMTKSSEIVEMKPKRCYRCGVVFNWYDAEVEGRCRY